MLPFMPMLTLPQVGGGEVTVNFLEIDSFHEVSFTVKPNGWKEGDPTPAHIGCVLVTKAGANHRVAATAKEIRELVTDAGKKIGEHLTKPGILTPTGMPAMH